MLLRKRRSREVDSLGSGGGTELDERLARRCRRRLVADKSLCLTVVASKNECRSREVDSLGLGGGTELDERLARRCRRRLVADKSLCLTVVASKNECRSREVDSLGLGGGTELDERLARRCRRRLVADKSLCLTVVASKNECRSLEVDSLGLGGGTELDERLARRCRRRLVADKSLCVTVVASKNGCRLREVDSLGLGGGTELDERLARRCRRRLVADKSFCPTVVASKNECIVVSDDEEKEKNMESDGVEDKKEEDAAVNMTFSGGVDKEGANSCGNGNSGASFEARIDADYEVIFTHFSQEVNALGGGGRDAAILEYGFLDFVADKVVDVGANERERDIPIGVSSRNGLVHVDDDADSDIPDPQYKYLLDNMIIDGRSYAFKDQRVIAWYERENMPHVSLKEKSQTPHVTFKEKIKKKVKDTQKKETIKLQKESTKREKVSRTVHQSERIQADQERIKRESQQVPREAERGCKSKPVLTEISDHDMNIDFMDESYELFPKSGIKEGEWHFAAGACKTVGMGDCMQSSSDSEEVIVSDSNPLAKPPIIVDVDDSECELTSRRENFEFGKNLLELLKKPFNKQELQDLFEQASIRKPVECHLELRSGPRIYATRLEGKSYLDHYTDLAWRINSVATDREKLNLLRGFFYWVKYVAKDGSFHPWTCSWCLEVLQQ